jgi:hypothetical protein
MQFASRAATAAQVRQQLMDVLGLADNEIFFKHCVFPGIHLHCIRASSDIRYKTIRNVDVLAIDELTANSLANEDITDLPAFFGFLHEVDPIEQFDHLRQFLHNIK